MYRVPPARAWWHAVGAPLEQVVRPCTVLPIERLAEATFMRQVSAELRLQVKWYSCLTATLHGAVAGRNFAARCEVALGGVRPALPHADLGARVLPAS